MIFMGTSNIQDLKYGNINIASAYWGSDLVWQKTQQPDYSNYKAFINVEAFGNLLNANNNFLRYNVTAIRMVDKLDAQTGETSSLFFLGMENKSNYYAVDNNITNIIYKNARYYYDSGTKFLTFQKPSSFGYKNIYFSTSYLGGLFEWCDNLEVPVTFINYDRVLSMENTYRGCTNLRYPVCGNYVKDMHCTYEYCTSLEKAVCGPSVINLVGTFSDCYSLIEAKCGERVRDMSQAYNNCANLVISACGDNVRNMIWAYRNCKNLVTPTCGNNVDIFNSAYTNCSNLTTAVVGKNVVWWQQCYHFCDNITGNIYLGDHITGVFAGLKECFYPYNDRWLMKNFFLNFNSYTYNSLILNDPDGIVWNYWANNLGCENTKYNMYVYFLDKM